MALTQLLFLSASVGHFPFMEYASVYALQNWARKDPVGDITYNNLKLIRAFESHEGSEKGFMCVIRLAISSQNDTDRLVNSAVSCMLTW